MNHHYHRLLTGTRRDVIEFDSAILVEQPIAVVEAITEAERDAFILEYEGLVSPLTFGRTV